MEGGRERAARVRARRRPEEQVPVDPRTGSDRLRLLASAIGNRAFSQAARAQLQRKIGFEIETALPASRAVAGEDQQLRVREIRQALRHQLIADIQSTSGNRERVRPKERMHDGPGWYATADNTKRLGAGSRVNVELVTDPPLPTGRDKAAELQAAVDHVRTMQDWAQGFVANAGTRRTPVGADYAIGFPSATQVTRLGEADPDPKFRPTLLGTATATTAWNGGVCTLTIVNDTDTITMSHGPRKQLDVRGERSSGKKRTNLNIAKCKQSLGDAGFGEATAWIKAAVSEKANPPEVPDLPAYGRDLTNTDGYVQVNVGVSLGHVAAMGRYEALQNPPRDAEAIARDRVPEVVRRLKLVLPDVPELDLEGLATLLGAAVIGGRDYAVKALIKNQWGTLTKSELHSWWKAHLAATNRDIGQTYLSSVPALVEAFVQGLGVPAGNRLLLHYSADDIAEIPQIANLAHLTVGQYLTEVLSFTADKLTAGVLAHRDETVGESSVIGAHGVGGDTGQQDAPPVGVLELRNIQEYWPGGSWAEVERLQPYLDLAYTGARKREG